MFDRSATRRVNIRTSGTHLDELLPARPRPPAAPVSPAAHALSLPPSLPPALARLLGFRRARRFFRSLQSRWIIVLWTVNEKEGRNDERRGGDGVNFFNSHLLASLSVKRVICDVCPCQLTLSALQHRRVSIGSLSQKTWSAFCTNPRIADTISVCLHVCLYFGRQKDSPGLSVCPPPPLSSRDLPPPHHRPPPLRI